MVRALLLQSFVLSALAAVTAAHQGSMNGMPMAQADSDVAHPAAANTSVTTGTPSPTAPAGLTPGVLSADGKCFCPPAGTPPALPSGHAPPAVPVAPGISSNKTQMPPAMNTPIGSANTTTTPVVPGVPDVPSTENTTSDSTDSTSGVAFLKGSSNACLLTAAAVVGISSLVA